MKGPTFNEAEMAHIRELYEDEGWSSPEIATAMHCCPQTIRNHLRQAGVTIRPKGGSPPLKGVSHQELELYRFLYWYRKWSLDMIAKHLGIPLFTIQWRMAKAGIDRRGAAEYNLLAYQSGRNWRGKLRGEDRTQAWN